MNATSFRLLTLLLLAGISSHCAEKQSSTEASLTMPSEVEGKSLSIAITNTLEESKVFTPIQKNNSHFKLASGMYYVSLVATREGEILTNQNCTEKNVIFTASKALLPGHNVLDFQLCGEDRVVKIKFKSL